MIVCLAFYCLSIFLVAFFSVTCNAPSDIYVISSSILSAGLLIAIAITITNSKKH